MTRVNIQDKLNTIYEIYELDQKSRSQIYLKISFSVIGPVVGQYLQKRINLRSGLLQFKIILAEYLINKFSLRKTNIPGKSLQQSKVHCLSY